MFQKNQINYIKVLYGYLEFFMYLCIEFKNYYMKLAMFDFDNTLVKTPYEDSSYLDTPESLDSDKWEFKFNNNTIQQYNHESTGNSIVTVLLTNRIDKVKPYVNSILESKKLTFDENLYIKGKTGNRSKGRRVEKLLEKYPQTTEIEYWEDKDKHIKDVKESCKKYPHIKLKVNKVIT